jgi:O-Antigen ligase
MPIESAQAPQVFIGQRPPSLRVQPANSRPSFVHSVSLGIVWLSIVASAIVVIEPGPADVLAIGLIILLPTVGLVAITPMLTGYLALWFLVAACGFLAATNSSYIPIPATHTVISLYLTVFSFVVAAFVALRPLAHTRLILNGYLAAALIAAAAGLAGYYGIVDAGPELLTKFGRATGTFKDPNVFGPFLVLGVLYALHLTLEWPVLRASLPLSVAGFLSLAILVSFSRGAWFNLALSVAIFGGLAFFTAGTGLRRLRIILFFTATTLLAALLGLAASQSDKIGALLGERAQLAQSYDVGPDGRMGGQAKAIDLLAEHPFGIGALEFRHTYHHEDVHNVYLSMFLNAGWLGGSLYIIIVAVTLALGLRHAFQYSPTRPFFLIVYSVFTAHALEGLIIDTDHWRHFYLLLALIWGLMAAPSGNAARPKAATRQHLSSG